MRQAVLSTRRKRARVALSDPRENRHSARRASLCWGTVADRLSAVRKKPAWPPTVRRLFTIALESARRYKGVALEGGGARLKARASPPYGTERDQGFPP